MANAQFHFQLKDKITGEALSFAKIIPEKEQALLADLDGKFQLQNAEQKIFVKAVGYLDTSIQLYSYSDAVIILRPNLKAIQEVNVKPGYNPAIRIIDQAVSNRKKNHPMENDGFISHQYSKFIFDIDAETRRKLMDSSTLKKGDTTLLKLRNFFDKQYIFLIENASRHFFEPPYKEKEIIDAYKVSGFSDPIFSTFAQEMQSFHFYDNQVALLGKEYINPIAFGTHNRYWFTLEDTTLVGSDTTYTIFYHPRKGKNFEGLTGRLYINTNGFAIEKVTASPYSPDTSGMHMEITQEYVFAENTKWFPSKLSTNIEFYTSAIDAEKGSASVSVGGAPSKPKSYIVGKGSTYISSVKFNPKELEKERFNNVSTQTLPGAEFTKENKWNEFRIDSLSSREQNTYVQLDSFVKKNNLNKYLYALKVLSTGKIPVKYINLDLKRLINYNPYEGYRIGLGVETSERLLKPVLVGAYFDYGTKDKAWKYGAYGSVFIHRQSGTQLDLFAQNDVTEVGTFKAISSLNFLNGELARELYVKNKAQQKKAGLAFQTYVRSNMGFRVEANIQQVNYLNGYQYHAASQFDVFETSLIWSWNMREKVNLLGNQRIPLPNKFPKFQVQVDKGWTANFGFFSGQQNYLRLLFQAQQTFPILGVGRFSWCTRAGWTQGDVPLFFHQAVAATGEKWTLSVANTFETVGVNEFYHKKSAAAFLRWTFNAKRTKAKWNEPQLGFHYAYGIGEFTDKSEHNFYFRSMDKGFHEAGVFMNGLLVSGNATIGIGVFSRFGYYADADWKRNLMPKITVGFRF